MILKPILIFLCILICLNAAYADTIYLKNGEEVRGIVVEDYVDRLVISTYEGEKAVFKENIDSIDYDLTEQNLVQLGDSYMARREYEKAYFYYEKASTTNPEYKPAREKMNYIMGYLFRRREEEKRSAVKRRQEFESWPHSKTLQDKDLAKALYDDLGLLVDEDGNGIRVIGVRKESPAHDGGIKKNDLLVSVWGRFIDYMTKEEVENLILKESSGEIKMAIERTKKVKKGSPLTKNYKNLLGGRLDMPLDGLTLAEVKENGVLDKAGFSKGDLITEIDGESTRYMPLNQAIKIIEDRDKESVLFTLRRDITMWRK